MFRKSNPLSVEHVAIIMDGNGRWAKAQGLTRAEGHKKGAEVAKNIAIEASKLNIKYLTLYTFSAENWKRPKKEISNLLNLLKFYLSHDVEAFNTNNIKVSVIGNLDTLPQILKRKIQNILSITANNNGMNLVIAFSYGSRDEISHACRSIAKLCEQQELSSDKINAQTLISHLYTKNMPDPDLLIRTGGEYRISNFLLWQLAYTELFFTKTYWPDFTIIVFKKALKEFQKRVRTYGQ